MCCGNLKFSAFFTFSVAEAESESESEEESSEAAIFESSIDPELEESDSESCAFSCCGAVFWGGLKSAAYFSKSGSCCIVMS